MEYRPHLSKLVSQRVCVLRREYNNMREAQGCTGKFFRVNQWLARVCRILHARRNDNWQHPVLRLQQIY